MKLKLFCLFLILTLIIGCTPELPPSDAIIIEAPAEIKENIIKETEIVQETFKINVCIFSFSNKYTEYINTYRFLFENICTQWDSFSQVSAHFYPKYNVYVIEGIDWQWQAFYGGEGRIFINKKYWTSKLLDQTLAHEITHSATENLNIPSWLDEGLATYTEWKYKGTENSLSPRYFGDLGNWNAESSTYGENIKAYLHSGYVIKNLINNYGEDIVNQLIDQLKGKINTADSNERKNEIILTTIQEITKNPELTLDKLFWP